jgi:hypothetical protein
MIVTEAQYGPEEEATGKEQGGQEVSVGVFRVDIEIKTVETQLEVGVGEGLRVFPEEEVGEKQE